MHLGKILLLLEQKELQFSYEQLLRKYGSLHVKVVKNTLELRDIEFSGYLLIVADLHLKESVKVFLELCDFYSFSRELVVLISLYDTLEIQQLALPFEKISFIIKKPFLTRKLTDYLDKEIYKLKQLALISKKVDILIDIYDLHPALIGVYDNEGFFYYANMQYLKSYKIKLEQKKRLHFNDVSHCNYDFEAIKVQLFRLRSFTLESKFKGMWYEHIFFYTNRKYVIHIASDVSVKKEKELRLEMASSFFETTNEGIIIVNRDVEIESVNRAFTEITGYTQEEVLGKNPRLLKSGLHDNEFYVTMWNSIKAHGYWKGEIWNKRKNGQVYPQILSITKTPKSLSHEEFYMSVFTDISSLKKADEKVYYHANFDSLTTLPNRAYFVKELESVLKEAYKKETLVALFFIDVDKFKDVNDTYGHDIGDEMLMAIAKRLMYSVRKDDFVARIGGDEFVLIAKDIKEKSNVEKLAQKIQKRIKERLDIESHSFYMSLSMGIAIHPDHGLSSQELLKNADIAMYEVKESGRNNYKIYEPFMGDKVLTKNSMLQEVQRAVVNKEFIIYYQPIIDFKTQKIFGAEALVRWSHPQRGLLGPDEFLSYIFNTELEKKFGDFVIERVLQDLQKLNEIEKEHSLVIAINISREHFHSREFCSYIADMLKKYNVKPQQIELEVLETQLMYDKELSKNNIANLRRMGIRISLDDFGMEYSSLNYLKEFEVDKLKVERGFVAQITQDVHDLKIVRAIVNIAKVFDLKVQAEGVETQKHYEMLQEMGCDFSQGYFHSQAIAFEEFVGYYNNSMKGR